MTVKQLIEQLQQHSPDKKVLVAAYEDGYDELENVTEIKVYYKPTDLYWKGDYSDYPPDECLINAVFLPRP
jgi:hypothetical protein